MKEKTKEFLKKYLIGFILGFVSVGIVVVYAETYFPSNDVTYDNTESGLKSENVQGAIDELYGVCFPSAGDQIIEDVGLEKDPYECRYFFTGADPNNYIRFNNKLWRIISVECDGSIKIVNTYDIFDNYYWDTSGSSNWARPASLNTYLNSDYYNSLNATARSKIVAKDFSIGTVTYGNNDLADQVNDENSTKWNGKIALPTLSEYIRTNSDKSSCGTFSLNNDNYNSCIKTTWMNTNTVYYWWTLSPYTNEASFYISHIGMINGGSVDGGGGYGFAVRPTLYLSSKVKLSGNGTSNDPYVVS